MTPPSSIGLRASTPHTYVSTTRPRDLSQREQRELESVSDRRRTLARAPGAPLKHHQEEHVTSGPSSSTNYLQRTHNGDGNGVRYAVGWVGCVCGGSAHYTRVDVVRQRTQNPNKCTPYLRVISTKIEIFSSYTVLTSKKSTDLSSGRRPLSKSVEFFDVRTL